MKLTRETELHLPAELPAPDSDNTNQSVDVIATDKDGLTDLLYYDFRSKKWVSLTGYFDFTVKWKWYYAPVTKFDIT